MDTKAVEHMQPLLKNVEETAQEESRTTSEFPLLTAMLLPTGSALTFQILSPVLTNQGQCKTQVCQNLMLGLVAFCASLCFFLSFTDSVRDERGKVRYGVATFRGLWVMDGPVELSIEEANKYKVKLIDFFHALVSIMIFMALVLFDQNVVDCFGLKPSGDSNALLLMLLPASIGAIGCLLFVSFPSKRHGIGCPLSKN
ncbi:hypothetical protein ES319_D04G163100v1 [Gossypium barbadense]|uniref:DUF679 domain-containing protein n=1 Tax=Gossypium barbadense TaxID=3634 RepID=A0A5J5RX38_GOSBA|nr:hypothetical protein ES319_D04G163100v1 [Gossypium barbadense]